MGIPTSTMSYTDRLLRLGLPNLELRRLHLDLVYCYKMVFTARAYARAVLGVVILSVCLSVTREDCDKSKWYTADILIPHETAVTLLL